MVAALRVGNLRDDASSFVGRRREVSEVRRSLADARMLTLTGGCGVGKSRLALRVARDVQDAFPDGAWLVELAALADPELLSRTVGGALGLNDPDSSSAMDRLLDYLVDKHLLLVLDNCEHLLDRCAMLVGKLLAEVPGLCVLATSRSPLGVEGERVFTVPPMPVPPADRLPPVGGMSQYDAVRLFATRASAVLPGFQVEADNRNLVAHLCQRLEGIPLAIELAAVRLGTLSLDKVSDRLDNRFQLLGAELNGSVAEAPYGAGRDGAGRDGAGRDGAGPDRGAPVPEPRQWTLWTAIDWSFDLCSVEEKLLWQRLTVFAGDFDLQAAQETCVGGAVQRHDVFDLVAGLVDKSLLLREGYGVRARYRMLETVRQFGRQRLAAAGAETTMRGRHRDYYQRLVDQAEVEWFSPRQVEWLTRLQREHANLRVACEYSLSDPAGTQAALRMAAGLRNFWVGSGLVGEGTRWLAAALDADRRPTHARAKALWVAGNLALMSGDREAAAGHLEEGYQLSTALGDPAAIAYTTEYLGMTALFSGDLRHAQVLLSQAMEGHRGTGDLNGLSVTLNQLLLVSSVLDDPRAAAYGQECLFLCEVHGAQWSRSHVLWAVSLRQWREGDRRRSVALVREAIRLKRLFDDPWGTGLCLEVLAWAAGAAGRHERAAQLLGACRRAWQLSGASLSLPGPDMSFHQVCEAQARSALGEARFATAFTEGLQLPLETTISYALEERPDLPRRAPARADMSIPLTPRERQVADRIAAGQGNQAIAAALGITVRTTEAHVRNVLAKLGLTSRAQVGQRLAERASGTPDIPA